MSLSTPATASQASRTYVYLISIVAAVSELLFGFDIAVINGAIIFLRQQFGLTNFQTEIAASSLLVGCVFGAAAAGPLSDRSGRRRVLMLSAVLFAVSAIGAALPRNLAEFVAARFIGGLAIGVASVLAPIYVAEVAPREIRGRLVGLNQMAIVTGILMAYGVNWGLSFLGSASWRWMFAAAVVPTAVFFAALFFVPESPRWLIEKGRFSQALIVLGRIGGDNYAQAEAAQIQSTIEAESGTLAQLFEPGMRRPLVIAVALAILQQVTGINTVLFYGSIIFREHMGAASESAAIGLNVLIGSVNFAATIVALMVIDKLGRKPLLMFSAGAMGLCQLALGALFLVRPTPVYAILALMFVCTAVFAVGLGPGVWVLLAEIFPTKIRGRAMGVATVTLWGACVLLTLTYLSLVSAISITGAFWLYATMCLITLIVVWKLTPETKGRSLEEIEKMWKR